MSQSNPRQTESAPRRVLRGAASFMGATIARHAIMFVLLPVLTTRVSPEEYARVSVASTAAGIAIILMGLGLETPVFRMWFVTQADPERRARLLLTAKSILVVSTTVIATVGALLVSNIEVSSDAWSSELIILALVGGVAQTSITSYALPLLRAQDRTREYLRVQLAANLAQAALLALFVLAIDAGAAGWMLAVVLGQWCGVAVAARSLHVTLRLDIDRPITTELLRQSLPMIPHAAAHWSLAGVDRFVLLVYVPASIVGIYGLVYTMSGIVGIVLSELTRALMNEYGRIIHMEGESIAEDLSALATVQVIASLVVSFVAAVLGPPIFRLLIASEYASGAAVIPWVVLGYMFFGLYYIFVVRLTIIDGRSGLLAAGTIIGALSNLGANFMLIPRYGMQGAALATAFGYVVMLLAVGVYVQRVGRYPLRISGRPLALLLFLLGGLLVSVELADEVPQPWHSILAAAGSSLAVVTGFVLARRQLSRLSTNRTAD